MSYEKEGEKHFGYQNAKDEGQFIGTVIAGIILIIGFLIIL